ncbi:putative siderophore iron transporter mirb protein [Neofusicoccum parvum UCRNP2]|uniref:Putative siderophore iron transporter mirb protein n=1 Tax=Botryosphaeria parva (strain UCR-NP2) TaxID=1287680 RepID=R1GQB3_BOTPV|nr:putative siderophore iron transporter mirb protein [Neofusicoccum parvum UCRNP2]
MASTLWKKFIPSAEPAAADDSSNAAQYDASTFAEGSAEPDSKAPADAVHQAPSEERPNEAAQDGVTQAEAITLTMWCLYFVNAFQSQITSNLSAYITSDFESHSLIPVIDIVSSVMGAATYMPVAKILNLWDRSIGFALMTVFAVLGLILSATCNGIGTYCAAQKNGLLRERERVDRTLVQSIIHYAIEFDLLGVVLLTAGLVLFLLPFTIAGSTDSDWKTASIIVMLVVGIVCLLAFAAVEHWVAPVPFLPWEMLATRTVLGACLVDATYQIAYYCWDDYYTSYLQVVYGVSIETAGYISSIFDVVSGVWLLGVGLSIKMTGRFRWLLLWSVPLYLLGEGLMIYFRQPHWSVGYNIMCQVFLALSGGTMIIVQQVAVLAVADHNNAASALAFLNVFGNMGSAVGSSISGAIWTHTLPAALQRLLPESAKADWETIYDSLDVQLSYARGTPVRHAINLAYAEAQSKMLIAGTAIMALSLGWMFLIKDLKVTKTQTKGVLF